MSKHTIKGLEQVPEETQKALLRNGYKNVKAIAIALPEDLAEDCDLSIDAAEQIIARAVEKITKPAMSAEELLDLELNRGKLTTSSNALDALLGGGFMAGEITEIAGGFSTGKTQLCFQLCVNSQLPSDVGGLDGKVFYIDTEGTFSATRVGEMAIALDMDAREVLRNIIVARALDSSHQSRIVQKINEIAEEENIRLVIVDSIASHFRSDYIGKDKLPERQQKIMLHASSLTNLAYVHDLVVIVTNQMVQKIDQISGGSRSVPALGDAWSHRPQTRIELRKSPAQARMARLTDSPRRPEAEEVFYITQSGIRDRPNI
ncbi:MAG: DNA repair and recombination protein RadA [Candidatus Heimdallarchaeota archaeon]|nr:DNA repair and recombination protein RadA [Candidatus Heimdallarchaeota archaeon]